MRRLGALTLALGFGLSFVVACLGACFAGAPGGDHGCCPQGDEAFRAAGRDCCSVVPGESHAAPSAIAAADVTHTPPLEAHSAATSASPVVSVTPTASPPLVLRI